MATVRDMITDALIQIGMVDPSESVNAGTAQAALRELNRMIQSWNIQGLMTYALDSSVFSTVGGQQDYTYGAGGNFDAPRPTNIDSVSVLLGNPQLELPIQILTDDQWRDVGVKSTTSTFPTAVHIHGDFPLNTLSFWPIPASAGQVRIYFWHLITEFSNINTPISLPQGYEDAIVSNLAIRLAPSYGVNPSPVLGQMAVMAKKRINNINWQPTYRCVDEALSGSYNSIGIRSRGMVVD